MPLPTYPENNETFETIFNSMKDNINYNVGNNDKIDINTNSPKKMKKNKNVGNKDKPDASTNLPKNSTKQFIKKIIIKISLMQVPAY